MTFDPNRPYTVGENKNYIVQNGTTFYYDDTAFKLIAVWWDDIDFRTDESRRAWVADRIMREIGSP